jgi:hypothetical protein
VEEDSGQKDKDSGPVTLWRPLPPAKRDQGKITGKGKELYASYIFIMRCKCNDE